jgi:protein-serine/threonine kinase
MNNLTSPTSAIGSPRSHPGQNDSAVSGIQNFNTTRRTAASSEQYPKAMLSAATEKPSVTRRVTRILSTKHPTRSASETSVNSQPAKSGASTPQLEPPSEPTWIPLAEKTSSTDTVVTTPTKGRAVTSHAAIQRYIILPDVPGGHEHHLKSVKRQEKLWNMFRNIISGKQRNVQEHHEEQQLSIVVSWVD